MGLVFAVFLVSVACAVTPHHVLPAETLSGTKLNVLDDLPKKSIVFVVGFSKAAKSQTIAWSRALKDKLPADMTMYSVSVIEDVPGFLRGFVERSIRHGVPAALHNTFLLVSEESAEWKLMASYNDQKPDNAYVFLMNIARNVVWQVNGSVTAESLSALINQLKSQVSQTAPNAQD